jgi:NAD(P)-dependent dehydrogenase (short-subunit alcohol dehydrogenase family)
MIAIRGFRSWIAQQLLTLLPADESVLPIERDRDAPRMCDRYLFCAGVLHGKRRQELTTEELTTSLFVNWLQVVEDCDRIFAANDVARVCVIGSESGFAGSYDDTYAEAKKQMHAYIERKTLRTSQQQLVCIAPSIIADAGMTTRRKDIDHLALRREQHPKQRFLQSIEVARLVHHVLYVDRGYLSGVTIRVNGGAHTQ